jgi:competence ComEA-like helix-hairpin-helix protein
MILTAEERRALLALLGLLLVGQIYALWEGARRAHPDRELSRWLERMERARGDSLCAAGLGSPGPTAPGGETGAAESSDSGAPADSEAPGGGRKRERALSSSKSDASFVDRLPPGILEQGRLLINRAGAKDLEALPGIGPGLARKILQAREASGPFRRPEDLLRVSGIGPKKLAALRERIDCSIDPAAGAGGGAEAARPRP